MHFYYLCIIQYIQYNQCELNILLFDLNYIILLSEKQDLCRRLKVFLEDILSDIFGKGALLVLSGI